MNKKVYLIVAGLISIIILYLIVSPYITLLRLKNAFDNNDKQLIIEYIDYDAVRKNFKEQIFLAYEKEHPEENNFKDLSNPDASKAIDVMLATRFSPSAIVEQFNFDKFRGQLIGEKYVTFNKFILIFRDTETEGEFNIVLRRNWFGWKITEISIPKDTFAKKDKPESDYTLSDTDDGVMNEFSNESSNLQDYNGSNDVEIQRYTGGSVEKINFSSLSEVEKHVVDNASKYVIKNFASCNNADYMRGEDEKLYEIKDYKKIVLIHTSSLNKSSILNGMLWRGDVGFMISQGVAREIYNGGKVGNWIESSDAKLLFFHFSQDLYSGNLAFQDGNLYKYYDGKIYGNPIRNLNDPLSCYEVNKFIVKKLDDLNNDVDLNQESLRQSTEPIQVESVSYIHPPKLEIADSDLEGQTRNVRLRISITATGRVDDVQVIESSGLDALDQKLLQSVKRATFKPHYENGIPMPVYTVQPFELNLSGQE